MVIFQNGRIFVEFRYTTEEELEKKVVDNAKLFFGTNTIYIDAKKKIKSKELGGSIPDGFLFDLSDKENPEFYLVEVELSTHDFFTHIFPQVTKFFAFFKNNKSQTELVEKIFSIVNTTPQLKDEFKKYLGEKEIYKFVKDVIENSQNILLIIDGEKKELPEIIETYSDTWGKMVKPIILQTFSNNDDFIYSLDPDFASLEYAYDESTIVSEQGEEPEYSEEFHLDGVKNEVKEIYLKIKEELLKTNKKLVFNPQKYYISIISNKNIAFFRFRKKKIKLVVMMSEEQTKEIIKKHIIEHLSEGVQKFYNGPSCALIIDKKENIDEVIQLLKVII